MGIMNLFSRSERLKKKAGRPDVYIYDNLPTSLRIQIVHIWNESIGVVSSHTGIRIWENLERVIMKEHRLVRVGSTRDAVANCHNYFVNAGFHEAMDVLQLSCRALENIVNNAPPGMAKVYGFTNMPEDTIGEINDRLREDGLGYRYEDGQIMRVDSEFIHAEVVKEALRLMSSTKGFSGPEQEFLHAHEHYRHGRSSAAMVEALKSFESTMKSICVARKWTYDPKSAASGLIKTIFDNELVPKYLETHFAGLRGVLEAGLPTVRNKNAGHGQGPTPIVVPDYMAAYALHMAAANIVMLVEAHNAKK